MDDNSLDNPCTDPCPDLEGDMRDPGDVPAEAVVGGE